MMAQVGDIVTITTRGDSVRWVVAELLGSPAGWPLDARLVRPSGEGPAAFVTSVASLAVVESPVFSPGERVRVGSLEGEVISSPEPGWTSVRLDAHARSLDCGGSVEVPEAVATVPLWQLTLENRT